MSCFLAILAAIVIGTWNGNWFPSGRAEHRAHPEVEDATITAAAKMLANGLSRIDPAGTNEVILCLNEIRGPRAASNLVERIGRQGLHVAVVSGYRRRDRFDQQQDVIATTLPIAHASWSRWRQAGKLTPPRGYAYAEVKAEPNVILHVYATHLKSNYGATTPEIAEANREKRALAIAQLLEQEGKLGKRRRKNRRATVLAGDFNADRWRREFAQERIFGMLDANGYSDLLALLPANGRGTHPSKSYGDSTLDYVFVRELESIALPVIVPSDGLSDHNAVFTLVQPK